MKNSIRILSNAHLLLAVMLILALGFAITRRSLPKGSVTTGAHRADSLISLPASPQRSNVERGNVAIVSLRPSGFDPSEMIVSGSPFVLSIDNRTGLQNILLILTDGAGNKLREVRLQNRRKWKEKMDLAPGRYLVTEPGHPDWILHVTVSR